LDLFASYLFGKTVELEAIPLGIIGEAIEDETTHFLRELEGRHAIACGIKFKEILNAIERSVSSTSVLRRAESKGAIRGRLDIPQYIARRATQRSLTRTYPIIINEEVPNTPENALARLVMRGLAIQLGRSPFPRNFAEGRASLALYGWVRSHLQRLPWADVRRVAPIQLLQRESLQRIRKRQTGNDFAYAALIKWSEEWQADISRLGAQGKEKILNGLLAFPVGDFFWEKVFEVWCLYEVVQSLVRCGANILDGPEPLHRRGRGPIYRFSFNEKEIEVWFQRQLPMGDSRWYYNTSRKPLRGIPDIVISDGLNVPLVVDAKFRQASSDTRSEETYKLLGYAENFRNAYRDRGFQGVLVFVGDSSSESFLVGPNNGRLSLIVADKRLEMREIHDYFDNSIRAWLI
jgi:hypothetical protein